MNAEKIRNQNEAELQNQQRDLMDQLFKLKFQMKMGQTESLNKIRGLRKDVARVKTIMRERVLGLNDDVKASSTEAKTASATTKKAAAPKKASAAKSTKSTAKKSATKKAVAKKK